jgi:hypothetical protein
MEMWLFFSIFGAVIFVPSTILFLVLQRFRNTICVLLKINGALKKVVITNKILEKGEITIVEGKKVKPIKIFKSEIYYGKWRRWIIKGELESLNKNVVTDKEVEEYLNNEDLLKLYLAGKFKDTLLLLMGITIAAVIIGAIINGYLTSSKETLGYSNNTAVFIKDICKSAINEILNNNRTVMYPRP